MYLLKHKSDSFATLKSFCAYAEYQFDRKVRIVRSDNALEFRDRECIVLFTEKGIIHRTTYVDRPQQNSVVERKDIHLLEISRALMFGPELSLSYWADCVMAAAHIINKLPSSILKNKTPFEKMFENPPNYSNLKAFGCLAMAYNPDRYIDKFTTKFVPCLFVGYPTT